MLMWYINLKCKICVLNINLCLYFLVSAVASSVSFCTWIWFSCCPCFGCIVENGFLASDWRIQFKGLTRSVHLQCPYFQMCTFVYNIIVLLLFLKCVEHCATFSPPLNCRSYSQLTRVGFLLICRYCQQLWNSLPPMTELFELVSCNILINLENHYRHKLLTSKYAFNDKKYDFNVSSLSWKISYFCWKQVLIMLFNCIVNMEILQFHLVFPTRFTLMLLRGSQTLPLSFGNLLLNPCLFWLLRYVYHTFWF